MKTILFTNARDESNILEWILHHLNLGFDYIYIFDHKSKIPIYNLLKSNHTSNCDLSKVHIFRLDKDIIKINLMKIALQFSIKHNFSWLLYLDCDEFLVLNQENNVQSFLEKYKNFDQIAFNWLLFGSNYRNNLLNPNEDLLYKNTFRNKTPARPKIDTYGIIDKNLQDPYAKIQDTIIKTLH